MDTFTRLTRRSLRVARAIHDYAAARGWTPDSYLIGVSMNLDWNTLTVTVLSDHFELDRVGLVDDSCYLELMRFLRTELQSDAGLYESLSLHLAQLKDEIALTVLCVPNLSPDERSLDLKLLNPNGPIPTAAQILGTAKS